MKTYQLLIILLVAFSIKSIAQSNIGWRGLNRDGVYPEAGLLKSWVQEGPELLWTIADAGKGYSSPVISGDKVFVTGMDTEEKNEILTAYTLEGKKIYSVTYGSAWDKSYPETRTTPTVVGDKVYVISGSGEVVCLNAVNGKMIWSVNGGSKFGAKTNVWGVSESPLVYGNKVIFTPGGDQTTMVALDAATGETLWTTTSLNDPCSHVSPLLITHNSIKQIIGFSENYVYGVDPETGKIEWKFKDWDFVAKRGMDGICINTPLYYNGKLFISNAYEMRSHMLELNDDATGVKLLWRNDDLSVHTGGMVLVNGIIYGSNWFNNNNGDWVALDWNTGQTRYKTAWDGCSKGSVIAADNMLYCYEERRGTLALVRPNPEKFDIISEFRINKGDGVHWSHPVIDNGILYVRHGNAVMAYKIKEV
ncbi:MAG: PQQ-like beta-propeller repeat protein [Tannerella sp.]|jgi:outer membrane protein assembly factor BamB|nr:PQQ-like beta-propeller repeat protein [Tannerella sp.]